MLNVLERRRFVIRRPSKQDGRVSIVARTADGGRRVNACLTFASLAPEERQLLLHRLRRLCALADDHTNYTGPEPVPWVT